MSYNIPKIKYTHYLYKYFYIKRGLLPMTTLKMSSVSEKSSS